MSYEKQTWQTGDVVTSAKLNHMEDGIAAGGVLVVNISWDGEYTTATMDKTFTEILSAAESGLVMGISHDDTAPIHWYLSTVWPTTHSVVMFNTDAFELQTFSATDDDAYPVYA